MPRIRPPTLAQAPVAYEQRFFNQMFSELRDFFARINIPDSDPSYYGQIWRGTFQAITLGAGWTAVANYTTQLAAPKGVTQSLTPGTLTLDNKGVYQLMADITLTFDEAVAGRSTNIRLYDVTAGAAVGADNSIFVGRNAAGVSFSFVCLVDVVNLGHAFRLELGGGDTFANTRIEKIVFGVATV